MNADWNERFGAWAQAPSKTETDKIENAIAAIKKAVGADKTLAGQAKVFVQGSYRNRVNIRQDSDVDVGVLFTGNLFGPAYPPGKSDADFGVIEVSYGYTHFKNDLERALVTHFGRAAVARGDKAFDIHENSYRLDADVVPVMIHRRYSEGGSYICGTELRPDSGGRIINWPERLFDSREWPVQHYENGNRKNTDTKRVYRGVVRILKKLRQVMDDAGSGPAKAAKGFEIECLVWNCPNTLFSGATWYTVLAGVLKHLSVYLSSLVLCGEWGEVSEWKYLVKNDEPKRRRLELFVDSARKFIGSP